jgi:hypothetical protein
MAPTLLAAPGRLNENAGWIVPYERLLATGKRCLIGGRKDSIVKNINH